MRGNQPPPPWLADAFPRTAGRLLLLLALAGLGLAYSAPLRFAIPEEGGPSRACLELLATADQPAVVQIYFRTERDFNEVDSASAGLNLPGQATLMLFPLPPAPITALRLDPLDRPGRIVIHSLRLIARDGSFRDFDLGRLTPWHQIESLLPTSNGLAVATTAEANDPMLLIETPELRERTGGGLPLSAALHSLLHAWLACGLLCLALAPFPAGSSVRRRWAIALAALTVGGLAALLSHVRLLLEAV